MDDEPVLDVPPFVPARMVNEFVFCPRFFHLAWSSGETGENELTSDGKWIHRRVDHAAGRVAEDRDSRATSVTLSSARLGAIARIDIVETRDGEAVPIELKRGRPHDPDHPVWEPERIQLALQGLILRDNGFRVNVGEVRFAESREIIEVPLDDHLVGKVMEVMERLRAVAADPLPPPPLVDSPKCPTCIMAGACLPDEQNLLRARSERPSRTLVARQDAGHPVYVTEPGARVGIDGRELTVKRRDEVLVRARLIDVSQLAVFGNVQVSTQAVRELLSREIPICWFSAGGWFYGLAEGLPSRNVELRRRQALASDEVQVTIARQMVAGKVLNARTLLRRNARERDDDAYRELKRLAVLAERATDPQRLLGLEGGAARIYFSRFTTMVRAECRLSFDFERRTRRPPVDPVNALLSFQYALLVRECTAVLYSVGLDPYLGVYHRPRFGRPALALDLAEEFRPLIADSVVITLINNGEVHDRDFVVRAGTAALSPGGRRSALAAYERRLRAEITHPTFGYKVSYRRAMEVQARLLGAVLLGEFDTYRPIVTR